MRSDWYGCVKKKSKQSAAVIADSAPAQRPPTHRRDQHRDHERERHVVVVQVVPQRDHRDRQRQRAEHADREADEVRAVFRLARASTQRVHDARSARAVECEVEIEHVHRLLPEDARAGGRRCAPSRARAPGSTASLRACGDPRRLEPCVGDGDVGIEAGGRRRHRVDRHGRGRREPVELAVGGDARRRRWSSRSFDDGPSLEPPLLIAS